MYVHIRLLAFITQNVYILYQFVIQLVSQFGSRNTYKYTIKYTVYKRCLKIQFGLKFAYIYEYLKHNRGVAVYCVRYTKNIKLKSLLAGKFFCKTYIYLKKNKTGGASQQYIIIVKQHGNMSTCLSAAHGAYRLINKTKTFRMYMWKNTCLLRELVICT